MTITTLKLLSSTTQTNAPFSVGQGFVRGDVPAGSTVTAPFSDFQCVAKNVWPDGSMKFAVLSGRAALTANVPLSVPLNIGTPSAGTNLSLTDLKATSVVASISLTNAKDWTFATTTQLLGSRIPMSSAIDIIDGTSSITVNNSASSSGFSIAQDAAAPTVVLTASISGGTVGGLQTVAYRLKYKLRRNISSIVSAVNTRITCLVGFISSEGHSYDQAGTDLINIGNTFTFAGINGMTQLNGMTGTVTAIDPSLMWFEVNIDSTGFSTYTSGGTVTKNQLNGAYDETIAYVRTGGGLNWDGTAVTYSSSNSITQSGASWATTDWDTPFDPATGVSSSGAAPWVSGPKMSSWIYRKAIGTDAHLVSWLEVRVWSGGEVEILPWIENGYLTMPTPCSKSATYDFTLGGTSRCSVAVELKHHQRTPLINGAGLSYWLGGNVDVAAMPDPTYLQASELVPAYLSSLPAGHTRVAAQPATYVPLQAGSIIFDYDAMPSSGYQRPIGLLPEHDVLYLVAHDTDRAAMYKSVIRNGFSAGRYGSHYRDEGTNRPLRFSAYPTLNIGSGQGFKDTGGSSTGAYTPTPAGGNGPSWDVAHSPSLGYMAYLMTGRWYFMEEVQFVATLNYLGNGNSAVLRDGSKGLVQSCAGAWQTRSAAWSWRSLAQALCITPDTDTNIRNELLASVQANIDHFHGRYVAQTNNPFGAIGPPSGSYQSGSFWDAPWMQDFVTAAFGYSISMGLPLSSSYATKLAAFFQWKAKHIVGRLGADDTTFWYVNSAPYNLKMSNVENPDFVTGTGPWLADWGQVYDQTYSPPPPWLGSTEGVLAQEFSPGAFAMRGNMQPAIAYAIRHGVPGASEGYARLTSAVNWPDLVTDFDVHPVWGVKPASVGVVSTGTPGPSFVWDNVPLISGSFVWDTYRGLGIPASDIPTGFPVPAFLLNDISVSDPVGTEYRVELLTQPSAGTLLMGNRSDFTFIAPSGTYAGTQRVWKNGEYEDTTYNLVIGSSAVSVTFVTVSPLTVTIGGGSTQAFLATVVGVNNPSQNVTWSASSGSINSGGVFTAPAATSSSQSITITATSVVDNTKSGTSVVTIPAVNMPAVTSITVSPATLVVIGVSPKTFTATVVGINSPSQSVTWSVSSGSINSSGVFIPPIANSTIQTVTVTATSVQDGSKTGTAVVSVAPAPGIRLPFRSMLK